MATKRQVTLRFRDEYVRASKKQKGVILDRMCETLGIGRSTARRLLAQAGQHGNGAVPAARERPCRYSDQSRQLLVRVWVLMDMPCGKYLKAMLPQWLPVLRDCGELDAYDGFTFSEELVKLFVFGVCFINKVPFVRGMRPRVGRGPVSSWSSCAPR